MDPNDARALTILGHVRGFLYHRVAEAQPLHARALALNPNLPLALAFSGLGLSYLGEHAQGLAQIRRCRELSPLDPYAFFHEMSALVPLLLLGAYEAVARQGPPALLLNPAFTSTYKVTIAALGHLGRRAEAADILARLLRLEPDFSITTMLERTPLCRDEDRARYAEGLRLAG